MRIGLYGGSFDPVHLGHLLVARAACEELQLDRLYFIPAAQSPFKPDNPPIPAKERVRLLRLALAGESSMEIDLQEVERGGISYTIDTVRDYRKRFPEASLYYLVGADHISQLPLWREAQTLAQLTSFAIIPRPGERPVLIPKPFEGKSLQGFPFAVSSSTIRARIRSGLSIKHLTPAAVVEAIRINRLYL